MAKRGIQLKEKELATYVAVLFLFGMFLGFLCLKLAAAVAGDEKSWVDETYIKQIALATPSFDLYLYTVWEKLKHLFLYFLFALTWLNLPYTAFLVLRQGFLLGYLLTSVLPHYSIKGAWLVFSYYFPQALVAVPIWSFCFFLAWHAWRERNTLEYDADNILGLHKLKLLHLSGKRVVALMAACFAESALEVWIGTWFLQKAAGVLF